MGDNVVDCYVALGEMFPGGNCLNVAVNISRFGAQSAYIGAIGRDPAGDVIYEALQAEHVDISRLRRLDGPTAYCLIGHREGRAHFPELRPRRLDVHAVLERFRVSCVGSRPFISASPAGSTPMSPLRRGGPCLSYDFSTRRDAGPPESASLRIASSRRFRAATFRTPRSMQWPTELL